MKITKYVHSCLLVEEQGKAALIDPGNYTFQSKALDVRYIEKLDFVLITHEHQDHLDVPFLRTILAQFPNVEIISNPSVVLLLEQQGVKASSRGNKDVSIAEASHERLPFSSPPQNILFHVFSRLTHPGDSFAFFETREVLALPVQAPWGSTTQAVEKALQLRPRVVIPIHDWHWRDEARKTMYERLAAYFKEHGIEFRGLETGNTLELE
ncbi:MAG: MBL fold metallo-hydrolase [Parcubacteria group bacterium]|nr:MBL fold metallo-hydrolase [Parcubacteria group bacterium]